MFLCIVVGGLSGALVGWLVKKLTPKWRTVLLLFAALSSVAMAAMVSLLFANILPFILAPLFFLLAMALQLSASKDYRLTLKQLCVTSWALLSPIVGDYRVELASFCCVSCEVFIEAALGVYVSVGAVLCWSLLRKSKKSPEKEYCWFMYWIGLILLYSYKGVM